MLFDHRLLLRRQQAVVFFSPFRQSAHYSRFFIGSRRLALYLRSYPSRTVRSAQPVLVLPSKWSEIPREPPITLFVQQRNPMQSSHWPEKQHLSHIIGQTQFALALVHMGQNWENCNNMYKLHVHNMYCRGPR